MEYVVPAILLILIFSYAALVIRRKIKKIKAGQFCSCGCGDCPSSKKCNKNYN
ncbi:MAG: FeoB-associated Cys-rich membrane protein [bacterium]|nr:FeoB-associated Cys-rich membrane protein [bacterium]